MKETNIQRYMCELDGDMPNLDLLKPDRADPLALGVAVDIDDAGDIVKTVLQVGGGNGKPTLQTEVNIHYTARFAGEVFESTLDEDTPRPVLLGSDLLPHGLEKAICRMYQVEILKSQLLFALIKTLLHELTGALTFEKMFRGKRLRLSSRGSTHHMETVGT